MKNIVSFLRDTKSIGELSELIVALSLSRAGYFVSKPLGESTRYDLVIDKDGKLSRVQVKTGRLRNGVILFNTYSTRYHRKGGTCKSYKDDVDFFGIYCPELHSVYLILDRRYVEAQRYDPRHGNEKQTALASPLGAALPHRYCLVPGACGRVGEPKRSNRLRSESAVVA